MNRSTIIGIIAIPLIIAGLIALSRSQSTPSDTPGSLAVVGESAYSFGSISMQDGKVSRDFIIENTGEKKNFSAKFSYFKSIAVSAIT